MAPMTDPIDLSCRCGRTTATLDAQDRVHISCFCKDCRAFARLKGDADALEPGGGVRMVQSTIDRLSLQTGADNLCILKLKQKGTLRWYASCCDAPMWLTLPRPGVPHLSVPSTRVVDDHRLGAVMARVNTNGATGPFETGAHYSTFGVIMRMIWRLIRGRFRGAARKSPLYDPDSGYPIVKPALISAEAHARAYLD